eukprot:gene10952-14710_t
MLRFVPIPTEIARAYQAGGADSYGLLPERQVSDGGGNPGGDAGAGASALWRATALCRDGADLSVCGCLRGGGWRWGFTFAWHYRTAPVCKAFDPKANCSGGNCVTAQIVRAQRVLADERLPAHERLAALAFLVHFA